MASDLLITTGRIINGSGVPAFHGDGLYALGKLSQWANQAVQQPARSTLTAAWSPPFMDNHCHYDSQTDTGVACPGRGRRTLMICAVLL